MCVRARVCEVMKFLPHRIQQFPVTTSLGHDSLGHVSSFMSVSFYVNTGSNPNQPKYAYSKSIAVVQSNPLSNPEGVYFMVCS